MPSDPVFWIAATIAVLIVGFSKGGFAGAGAIAGVPTLSLVIDPASAVAIMLPLLLFMDVIGIFAYRKRWSMRLIKTMIPGAVVGIAFGTLTFSVFNADVIRLVLGLIVMAFTLNYWLQLRAAEAKPALQPSHIYGNFFSSIAGFTSFVAHAGHPPVAIYLLPQKLDRTIYQATSVLFFFIVNWVKLPPYIFLDLFNPENLSTSAALAPLVPVGMFLGIWLHKRVSNVFFTRFIYAALSILGPKLVYDGASSFF